MATELTTKTKTPHEYWVEATQTESLCFLRLSPEPPHKHSIYAVISRFSVRPRPRQRTIFDEFLLFILAMNLATVLTGKRQLNVSYIKTKSPRPWNRPGLFASITWRAKNECALKGFSGGGKREKPPPGCRRKSLCIIIAYILYHTPRTNRT